MAISVDAMPGIQKLYQADSRAGKVDKVVPEKPRGPTFYRRELMTIGAEEKTSGRLWWKKTDARETVGLSYELKEKYRRFLADHVQRLMNLQEKNPQVLDDPLHAHEKRLLHLFVGEGGKIDMGKISEYLGKPDGWITTTQLLEEQIALRSFTLSLQGEAMQKRGATFAERLKDPGINLSTLMTDNTTVRQRVMDVFRNMAADEGQVAYIKSMTDMNMQDFDFTGTRLRVRIGRQPELSTDPEQLRKKITEDIKTRREFYKSLGINEKKIDSFPIQFLLLPRTGFTTQELTGFLGQKQVMEFFDPNAGRGVRDALGRGPEDAHFDLTNLDVVGNIKRFHEAQVRAMSTNLQKEIDRQGLKGADRRISELEELSKTFGDEGEARKAAQAPFDEKINALERDKGELAPAAESVDKLVTKVNQLYKAEGDLRQALSVDFPIAYPDAAAARTAITEVLRRSGTSIVLSVGGTIDSITDSKYNWKTAVDAEYASLKRATPRDPDKESEVVYKNDLRDSAEAKYAAGKNTIDDNERTLNEILAKINSAEQAVEQAKNALSTADPEKQTAEQQIASMQKDYGAVLDYDEALDSFGASKAGLDENALRNEPDDQLMKRINTAHDTAIATLNATISGFDIRTVATGAPNAAAAAAAIGAIAGIAAWPKLIDTANAAAVMGGATSTSVANAVEATAATMVAHSASQIGWAESENSTLEHRRTALYAKAYAQTRQLEREDLEVGTQSPPFEGILASNHITEDQLRSLPIDQATQLIAEKKDAGATFTIAGTNWASVEIRAGKYRPQIENAIKFAQKRPVKLASVLHRMTRDIDGSVALLTEQKQAVDVSEPKRRVDMTKTIAERQEKVFQTVTDIIARRADYTNTGAVPTDFSEAERTLPNVNLAYTRFLNIFSEHMSKTGAARDAAFREFYKFLPPDQMRDFFIAAFDIRDRPHPTLPPPARVPVTTFDELMGELNRRITDREDSVSEFNLIRGFTRTINTLAERVKPPR